MANEIYSIAVGERDKQRLELLNEIFNPNSQLFLLSHALASDLDVLDVGCGIGVMSRWFAHVVGETGTVVAVDLSQEQLAIAKKDAQEDGVENIDFINMPAENVDDLNRQFDYVYSRFLLMHTTNPRAVVQAVYNALKPGGIFVCESAVMSASYSMPPNDNYNKMIELFSENVREQGADPDYGLSVSTDFREIGFVDVEVNPTQILLKTAREKSLQLNTVINSRDSIVGNNLSSEEDFDNLMTAVAADVHKREVVFGAAMAMQVAGKKPL